MKVKQKKKWTSIEELERLYNSEHLSSTEISAKFNCSRIAIEQALRRNNITFMPYSKRCSTCSSEFIIHKPGLHRTKYLCVNCLKNIRKERLKKWRKNNPNKYKLQRKMAAQKAKKNKIWIKYYKNNKENIKKIQEKYLSKPNARLKNKIWRINHKKEIIKYREINRLKIRQDHTAYLKRKREKDLNYVLSCRLRNRLRAVLNLYTQKGKINPSKYYGIDFKAIIEHLKPFPQNIKEYHIDHIKPLCMFDLTNPEQIKQAFAPENHQWLTISENCSKNRRYPNGN